MGSEDQLKRRPFISERGWNLMARAMQREPFFATGTEEEIESVLRLASEQFVTCPICGGARGEMLVVPRCCNNPTPSGECCDDPVPDHSFEPCSACGGYGEVPAPPSPSRSEGPPNQPEISGDGWIPWNGGGSCPVARSARVEVKFQDGETGSGMASWFRWNHEGLLGDITSYRLTVRDTEDRNQK